MKVIWNNEVIAESDNTIVIKDEHYFPVESVKVEFLKKNGKTGRCEEKGGFCNYNLQANGEVEVDAAMSYIEPIEGAEQIRDYVVFNQDLVEVVE